jgi:hypothetical protein
MGCTDAQQFCPGEPRCADNANGYHCIIIQKVA